MQFFAILLLVCVAFTQALPFFNAPTSQTRGGQWQQYYGDYEVEVPQNSRFTMSNRMRG